MTEPRYRVFISHAGSDLAVAGLLATIVKAAGARCVLDSQCIQGGADFLAWMQDEIAESHELLLLLSPAALESEYVKFELGLAMMSGLWITPILHHVDAGQLSRSKIISLLLGRTSHLRLEQFELYQQQLASRVVDFSRPASDPQLVDAISKALIEKKERSK